MSFVYLDTETTSLDFVGGEVWEIALAADDRPIQSAIVAHSLEHANPDSLRIGGHDTRCPASSNGGHPSDDYWGFEVDLQNVLTDRTLVGANPSFDATFLRLRWGHAPWKYRLLDIEAFAMPGLGLHEPRGLAYIAEALGVQAPDHTAAGDVHTLRECHRELLDLYNLSEGK